jgi:hypothetical protein
MLSAGEKFNSLLAPTKSRRIDHLAHNFFAQRVRVDIYLHRSRPTQGDHVRWRRRGERRRTLLPQDLDPGARYYDLTGRAQA